MNRFASHAATGSLVAFLTSLPALALAQGDPPSFKHSFTGQLLFWSVGFGIVAIMARFVFKEQLHERRTLKRMVHELGIFYPEFDIDAVKHWVNRCAPHLWSGWARGSVEGLTGFSTEEFRRVEADSINQLAAAGHVRHASLSRVSKIHPLGLYMVGARLRGIWS